MTQQQEHTTWTDEQHAAYELGMQTEREHQEVLARLAMRKHADALAAATAEVERLTQELAELRRGQYVPLADGIYSLPNWNRHQYKLRVSDGGTELEAWFDEPKGPSDVEVIGIHEYRLCRLAPQHNAAPDAKEGDE